MLLASAVLWMVWVPNVVSAACADGPTTLTTEACFGCNDYDLCLGSSSASTCVGPECEARTDCTYQCLPVDTSSATLIVLVAFGSYKSDEELTMGGYTKSDLAGYGDETSKWPSVSNDQVKALGRISVSPAVTTFIASGGQAAVGYPKGKVSSIILSSNMIALATSVTTVRLQNLGLANQIETLAAFLPSSVESLDLTNTLLTAFPSELGSLQVLKDLVLDSNYVTTVASVEEVESITTLSMQNNNLVDFTAVFTKLENLCLSGNDLTSIPSAIYRHANLKTLNLTGNSFASRNFSSRHANFLNSLQTLGLSSSDFDAGVDCGDLRQSFIFDVLVCITDDGDLVLSPTAISSTSGSKGSQEADTASASSSASSPTTWVLGTLCGAATAMFAAFVFVAHRRKEREEADVSIASDTVGCSSSNFSSADNWHQVLMQCRGRRRSGDVDVFIPRPSSVASMSIPTVTNEDSEVSEAPATATAGVYSIPPCTSAGESGYKNKSQQFMSIWNDLELLSMQLHASAIEDLKPLGSGSYATVWLVRYRNLQLLASKRLRPERRTKMHTAAFVKEIKLVAKFEHPNLVRLIGAAWTDDTDLQMLSEYVEGGDLREYLAEASTPSGWTTSKFNVAIDVIEALVYVHSFVPPLVHRDLNSKNVLLSCDMEAKLSDFETPRLRSMNESGTDGVGAVRWFAPEVIRGESDYGPAVDIFSFGILLTELDTTRILYNNVRGSNGKLKPDLTSLHRVATGALYPKVRTGCHQALTDLVERCLLADPSERPTAPAIAYELRVIQQDILLK
ncbi:unnamed protein product [Hyaloperonospora brassicae]|uniref:Protein kinase domain-containing protein n=1 Tax=Hyaloperonospora brassicae TaxID=162125 RepID=A0AAV0UCT1_HYABA|nr:unnamed protein product [Hyaloperonospora brassicae]